MSALFAPLPPVGVTPSRGYVDVVDKSGELGPGASLPRGGETGEERLLGVAVELVDILLPLLELLCAWPDPLGDPFEGEACCCCCCCNCCLHLARRFLNQTCGNKAGTEEEDGLIVSNRIFAFLLLESGDRSATTVEARVV